MTAFYAAFLPSRSATRANVLSIPIGSIGVSDTTVAQPQATVLDVTVTNATKAIAPANQAPDVFDLASLAAPKDDPNLRVLASGVGTPTPVPGATQTPTASTTPTAAGTPTPTPTPSPTPAALECDSSQSSVYCVYTIKQGDTLSGIAAKFHLQGNEDITPWQLLVQSNRPDIVSEDDVLQPGQNLRIPTGDGIASALAAAQSPASGGGASGSGASSGTNAVIHTVTNTQTLSDLADQYDVTIDAIVTANHLSNPDALSIGQELLIPSPKQFAPPPPPPTAAASSGSSGGSSSAIVAGGAKSNVGFIWPTTGPISSYFGPSHPLGIDIDLFSHPFTPIGAAMAGTVTFAGGNACCSYGYYVVINHGNGWETLYAHFSKIEVTTGQKVSQGQELGISGCTGYCTGNHLHFEVHLNGAVVNPLSYLP